MRRTLLVAAALALAACGSSTGPKKPDPYLVLRVQDRLDPQSTLGQADWYSYLFLLGPYNNQNGIASRGVFLARLGGGIDCLGVVADSVGQRLIQPFAVADTLNKTMTQAEADQVAQAWYSGSRTLRPGLAVLTLDPPQDAWNSPRYEAGHGLTRNDPIFWTWDWASNGATSFTELDHMPEGCPADIF